MYMIGKAQTLISFISPYIWKSVIQTLKHQIECIKRSQCHNDCKTEMIDRNRKQITAQQTSLDP